MAYEKRERDSYDRDGGGRDRDRGGDKDDRKGGGSFTKRKQCKFCADTDFILDYKDIKMMQSFMTEHGKIVPRRISGSCAHHQRKLTTAVKRARNIALVGYIGFGS